MNQRSFTQTLIELRDGAIVAQLTDAMAQAIQCVQDDRKEAKVILTLTVEPIGTKGVSDAIEVRAEVSTKFPKQKPPSTLFFVNADGQPTKRRDEGAQREIPSISGVVVGTGGSAGMK